MFLQCHKYSRYDVVIGLTFQSENDSLGDEDSISEDALSRADSRTDSRSDLHLGSSETMGDSTGHVNSPAVQNQVPTSELVYDQPWGASKLGATPQPKVHNFTMKTFTTPNRCNQCTSLMIGIQRQGTMCTGTNLGLLSAP